MSDATATDAETDVDPAAIAALKHVGLVGGLSETKVSCAALGDRLDASTQTASRRLQKLESGGYVGRDVGSDGQWVRVTNAGEAALRAEYADYRRLFESNVELSLRGSVTGGMGEGRHYITLSGYAEQFRERSGDDNEDDDTEDGSEEASADDDTEPSWVAPVTHTRSPYASLGDGSA